MQSINANIVPQAHFANENLPNNMSIWNWMTKPHVETKNVIIIGKWIPMLVLKIYFSNDKNVICRVNDSVISIYICLIKFTFPRH